LYGVTLKNRFNCLFELSDKKMAIVADMKHLRWGKGGEA